MTQNNASTADASLSTFLTYAAERDIPVYGTIPAGSAGGGTSAVTWQQDIPESPVWCKAVDLEIDFSFDVTVPAGDSFTVSPLAPYSGFSAQLTIAGAPPWPQTELTPWYIDQLVRSRSYEESYPDIFENVAGIPALVDGGPNANNFIGSTYGPGTTYKNNTTASAVVTVAWKFNCRMDLAWFRKSLWGAIPFGDPKNRPRMQLLLNPIIGINPEKNFLVNCSAGVTAVVTSGTPITVVANYEVLGIDILPSGVATPTPTVGFGLALNPQNQSISNKGAIQNFEHIDSAAYLELQHLLINGELPIQADYFGNWITQEQRSARVEFDASNNSFNEYFTRYYKDHKRYPLKGLYVFDLVSGKVPDLPSASPYEGIMSPDETYANQFGVAVTPNMHTALRVPSGASLSACYVVIYNFEYVRVSY
ncbi:MAG: hypothetical protein ABSC73_09065 [Acidimicrobiales bacterium]|jgi:hypothetical protein